MQSSRGRQGIFVTLLVLATFLSPVAAFSSQPRSVARAQESVALFESDQFDYFFFYDASQWQLVDQTSEPGSETVSFSDGQIAVDYWAFSAPGVSPQACLEFAVDALATEPSILAFEDLSEEGGPPDIGGSGTYAFVEIVATEDSADGRDKFLLDWSCNELVSGESLLFTMATLPAAVYNERPRFALPWIAGYQPLDEFDEDAAPVSIPAPDGAVQGTLAVVGLPCVGDELLIVSRALGSGGNFVVDPSSFVAVHETGEVTTFASAEWLFPNIPPDSSLAMWPGELGLLKLVGPWPSYDLYYTSATGESIYIGSRVTCAPAATLPVLIDME
jgi:hypothetical protein